MKGITSDVAARAVRDACYKKFPDKSPSSSEMMEEAEKRELLSTVQIQNIKNEGVSWASNGTGLKVKLYNGNSDVTIAKIVYRYRINDGKQESNWSNKHAWEFKKNEYSDSSFKPYSYKWEDLENLDVKKLPKNFSVSFEIVEARQYWWLQSRLGK